MVTKKIRFAF